MKSDTLNAGIEAEIIYAAGNSEFVHIRQIPVKDYPKGFSLVENEAALVSFMVSGPAPQTPDPISRLPAGRLGGVPGPGQL